jgi:nucleotide-binding universal stress UspA family protein
MSGHGQSDVYIQTPGAYAPGGGQSLKRILVPVDESGPSDRALALAARFAAQVGGQLRVVHVRTWDPPARGGLGRFFWETSEQATALLDQALTSVWACGVPASGVVVDAKRSRVADAVAAEARSWRAEVMVVARRPRTAIGVLLTGSLSNQIMRAAGCPVLVAHQGRRS